MDSEKLRVLVIDDDPGDAELLYRQLEDIPDRVIEYHPFTTYESGLELLHQTPVDVIFIDYHLGAQTGLDALRAIKEAGITRPVIMLTGQGNEKVAVEAMKSGAADYLIKRYTSADDLHRALLNALEKAALHEKIEEQRRELERMARTDGLTGLSNRRHFIECLTTTVQDAAEKKSNLSMLMMDLDHFKKVNDTFGHLAGDQVLVRTGELISELAASPHFSGRFGGEEFCIALIDLNLDAAAQKAEELRQKIHAEEFQSIDGQKFKVGASIGAAAFSGDGTNVNKLIHDADEALYRAKESGRNQVCLAQPV